MIFIGFGFLMTFLKRYGLSAISLNMLISAFAIQWTILVSGFFHLHYDKCPGEEMEANDEGDCKDPLSDWWRQDDGPLAGILGHLARYEEY